MRIKLWNSQTNTYIINFPLLLVTGELHRHEIMAILSEYDMLARHKGKCLVCLVGETCYGEIAELARFMNIVLKIAVNQARCEQASPTPT
jgi:hypothetical protein